MSNAVKTIFPRNYSNKLYRVWKNMKQRCTNPNREDYKYYGDNGINVCEEWQEYAIFEKWALNNGYKKELTIDRKNTNKGYYPDNCRWVSREVQSRNTRKLRVDNTSGYRGVSRHQKKFQSEIVINGKSVYLGYFSDPIKAAKAYDDYVIKNNLEHTRNFN